MLCSCIKLVCHVTAPFLIVFILVAPHVIRKHLNSKISRWCSPLSSRPIFSAGITTYSYNSRLELPTIYFFPIAPKLFSPSLSLIFKYFHRPPIQHVQHIRSSYITAFQHVQQLKQLRELTYKVFFSPPLLFSPP